MICRNRKQQTRRLAPLALIAALALGGCATTETKLEMPVWPKPPDEARFAYEATLRTEASLFAPEKGLLTSMSGKDSADSQLFGKPFDIAAGYGLIAVTDSAARMVHLINVRHKRVYRFGLSGEGKLRKPAGIAMDMNGNFYVADITGKRIVVYEPSGHFKASIGNPADFDRPADVAVTPDGSRIYVVDTGGIDSQRHRVLAYDASGKQLFAIGGRGSSEGMFNFPVQAAVGPDNALYVLDAGNFRVQVFDANGRFLRAWGEVGRNFGNLARPRGIAVDAEGHVYITDAAYANFQVFTSTGELLLPVGQPGPGGPGEFSLPAGIAVDDTGRVFVVEQRHNKVDVFRKLAREGAGQELSVK